MQEVLAVLVEAEAAAEVLGLLQVMEQEIMVVMAQQEAMGEEEVGEGLLKKTEVLVAAALVVLD